MNAPLLKVEGLRKVFRGHTSRLPGMRPKPAAIAVDGVSFSLDRGETLGIVGESGSGKSTVARMVLRLIDPTDGTVAFDGSDITSLSGGELRRLRQHVQAVFQDVTGSLNPKMTIGQLVREPLRFHKGLRGASAERRATQLLEMVGLGRYHLSRYPYELSGGQRQRVGLARSLAVEPELIVLDEPVSALDVSTQSQAVNLLADLQDELGMAYLFIAHDLFVVHHVSHRIAVMYLGRLVEVGTAEQIFHRPRHPYTEALLSAVPQAEYDVDVRRERLILEGEVPSPTDIPSGCRFRTRCPHVFERCSVEDPAETIYDDGGMVACHLHHDGPVLDGQSVTLLQPPTRQR